MALNPYLEPEDDSATIISEDEKTVASEDSKINSRQIIRGPNGEELPEEVQATLARHLTSWNSSESPRMPSEFRAIQALFEFFSTFNSFHQDGALLLSVAEVVDMISDGLLSKVYRLHESERVIMWTHSITALERVLDSMVEYVGGSVNDVYKTEIGMYFETLIEIIKWHQQNACQEYLKTCEELGKEPDHDFVQTGVLSERTTYQRVAMGHPVARKDV